MLGVDADADVDNLDEKHMGECCNWRRGSSCLNRISAACAKLDFYTAVATHTITPSCISTEKPLFIVMYCYLAAENLFNTSLDGSLFGHLSWLVSSQKAALTKAEGKNLADYGLWCRT